MAHQPYFKQKFETLKHPDNASAVVTLAHTMFEAEAWHNGSAFSETAEYSRLCWERNGERLAINLGAHALIIAIESPRQQEIDIPFPQFNQATMIIARGIMDRPAVYFYEPVTGRGIDDAVAAPDGWRVPMALDLDIPPSLSDEFRVRMNHSMARIGLEWQLAS